MNALLSLSKNTFREAIRDRILYIIFFFGFLILLASPLLGTVSAGQEERIITNFGLAMIHIFGLFLTIFVGSRLIFNEIQHKTIYLLIPKPIRRSHIILAKFLGLGAVLFITTSLMSAVMLLFIPFSWELMLIIGMMYLSFLLLLSIVLFFSAFMQPLIASVSTILLFCVGNITAPLKILAENRGDEVFQIVTNALYHLIPNFSNLNLKNHILSGIPYTSAEILSATMVSAIFLFLFLLFSIKIFEQKEFS